MPNMSGDTRECAGGGGWARRCSAEGSGEVRGMRCGGSRPGNPELLDPVNLGNYIK